MQAVVAIGGKQFIVAKGERIRVASLDQSVGTSITLAPTLIFDDKTLSLHGKQVVKGTVVAHGLAKKIRVFKHHAKKRYRRTQGHRQGYTEIAIESIESPKA